MWRTIQNVWGAIKAVGQDFYESDFYRGLTTESINPSLGMSTSYQVGETIGRAGDFLEGAYEYGKKIYRAYDATQSFLGSEDTTARLPTPNAVSAPGGRSYNPGSFRAGRIDYNKIGFADPRVRSAFSRVASSKLPPIQVAFNKVPTTRRAGRPNIPLTTTIKVKTKVT